MPKTTKIRFPGSVDALGMLRRAVKHGSLSNFNDVIADQLVASGYATVEQGQLVPTEVGRSVAETHQIYRGLRAD